MNVWSKMWFILFIFYTIGAILVGPVTCHVPSYASTPSNKIDQFCELAERCVHDTIPVCGKMGDETRSFLDACDMLEYACDTNQIYIHVEDTPGCPVEAKRP